MNLHLAGEDDDLYSGYGREDIAPELNTEDLGNHVTKSKFHLRLKSYLFLIITSLVKELMRRINLF